jgi:hypothetical protein
MLGRRRAYPRRRAAAEVLMREFALLDPENHGGDEQEPGPLRRDVYPVPMAVTTAARL